jgi:hypothetical protein
MRSRRSFKRRAPVLVDGDREFFLLASPSLPGRTVEQTVNPRARVELSADNRKKRSILRAINMLSDEMSPRLVGPDQRHGCVENVDYRIMATPVELGVVH